MAQYKVIKALKSQALADKDKALMALELLTVNASGIGDHTANDFLNDASESLQLLVEADDKLEALERYFPSSNPQQLHS
jgi:hypothetical protein